MLFNTDKTVLISSACSYVQSWIDSREVQSEKANLTVLFDRYIPILLECSRANRFKKITPIQEVSMIQTLCYLLEVLLTPANTPPDTVREVYELYFVFAAIWAFGGFLFQDQVCLQYSQYTCTYAPIHTCTYYVRMLRTASSTISATQTHIISYACVRDLLVFKTTPSTISSMLAYIILS